MNSEPLMRETLEAMAEYTHPYTSPISKALTHTEGTHHGTGNYYDSIEGIFLITNEHVAREIKDTQLTHKFHSNENIYKTRSPFHYEASPVDVAVTFISPEIWAHAEHKACSIPLEFFDLKHRPVKGEYLFMVGYSGERSNFYFGNLSTPGQPYLSQECDEPNALLDPSYNPDLHFSIHYPPEKAVSVKEGGRGLPLPSGFSGSLIWNTKRIESAQSGTTWTPNLARVTGIVWGWPSAAELLATKVEHFRDLIAKPSNMPNRYFLGQK